MKTKLLSIAIALLCSATALTAQAANYVTVADANGAKVSFEVSAKPTVTFTATDLVITAGEQTVEYPLTDYRSFTFTDDNQTTTGIGSVDNTGTNAVFTIGDNVHGEGLKAGSRVAVYSANGQLVGQATVSSNGSVDISLNGGNGVYIVKSASKTFKFIKK